MPRLRWRDRRGTFREHSPLGARVAALSASTLYLARSLRNFPQAPSAWREGRGTFREHPPLGEKVAALSASTPHLARGSRHFPRPPFPCHWPLRHFPRPPFPLSASFFQGSPRIRRRGSVKSTSPTPRASRFRGPSSGRQPVAVPKHRRRPSFFMVRLSVHISLVIYLSQMLLPPP